MEKYEFECRWLPYLDYFGHLRLSGFRRKEENQKYINRVVYQKEGLKSWLYIKKSSQWSKRTTNWSNKKIVKKTAMR